MAPVSDDLIYEGRGGKVRVHYPSGKTIRLPLARKVKDFTRSRLAWGLPARAEEPGQLQLAVALLAHALGDKLAADHYQHFHDTVLTTLSRNWTMSEGEIRDHCGVPHPAAILRVHTGEVTLVEAARDDTDTTEEIPLQEDRGVEPGGESTGASGESPPDSPPLSSTSEGEVAGKSEPAP